jgi:hypothetical protein
MARSCIASLRQWRGWPLRQGALKRRPYREARTAVNLTRAVATSAGLLKENCAWVAGRLPTWTEMPRRRTAAKPDSSEKSSPK